MVIRHSIKELLAKSMVTRPMKCIVDDLLECEIMINQYKEVLTLNLYIVILHTLSINRLKSLHEKYMRHDLRPNINLKIVPNINLKIFTIY